MASLVDQIFAQAQLGTAPDPNANPYATGVQLGQNQQRINLDKQQLAMELAQMPLRQTMLKQSTELNALKLEEGLRHKQIIINNESALTGLAGRVYEQMQTGKVEEAEPLFFDALSKNPKLAEDPRFQDLWKQVGTSLNAKIELQKLKGSAYTPGFGTAVNPVTGKEEAYFRTSQNSAQVIPDATTKPLSTLGKLMADRNAALQAKDTAAVANYDAEIKARQSKEGFSITTNPDGTFTLTQGPRGGETLTPTNKTRVQDSLQSSLHGIDVANLLEPLISTETVGVRAFAGSWVKDRMLAQAFPEMASSNRATAETLGAQLKATTISDLKSDSNITQKEADQILRAVPDINSPIDSPARAKQLVIATRKAQALRAIIAASKLKEPVPLAAAKILPPSELKRLRDTGVLTAEQAMAAYDAAGWGK